MNHQPFEIWLLSDEPLSTDEAQSLQAHLQECEQCRELQTAWKGVGLLFDEVPPMGPAPGFVNRWQTHLEISRQADRLMRQRWQSWILLIAIGNAAAFTLLLTGLLISNTYDSVLEYLLSWVYRGVATLTLLDGIQGVFFTLFRSIPAALPVGVWAILGAVLSLTVLIWIFSIAKLTSMPRRASK